MDRHVIRCVDERVMHRGLGRAVDARFDCSNHAVDDGLLNESAILGAMDGESCGEGL